MMSYQSGCTSKSDILKENQTNLLSTYAFRPKISKYFTSSLENKNYLVHENSVSEKDISKDNYSSIEKKVLKTSLSKLNCAMAISNSQLDKNFKKQIPQMDDFENDFQECKIESKLKNSQNRMKEDDAFTCVVCNADLTNLDLDNRTVHMNQCIDSQSSKTDQNSANNEYFLLECPLCFKNFPAPEIRSSHIKKCGKSRGLSTQSVIQALQLQEKHVLERKALGLPLNKIKQPKPSKKPTTKKFTVEPKNAMQSDIQLAKALSLSLEEGADKAAQTLSATAEEDIISLRILQPPIELQVPGRFIPNKKAKITPTPVLLLRTDEERNKIILDNVNAIIMPQGLIENEIFTDKPSNSEEIQNEKISVLWNLCGKAESKSFYYVEQLADWITLSNVDAGSKLCNLSQIAGHHIYTQLPCDYSFSCNEDNKEFEMNEERSDLSSSLISGLRSLIGNFWMSDVDIHTASGIVVPAHKLILAMRCPTMKMLFETSSNEERHILDFKNTSFDATLHFLNFLYTGSTEWKEDIIDDLTSLAKIYNVKDLQNILESDSGTLELMSIKNTQLNINSPIKDNNSVSKNLHSSQKKEYVTSKECIDIDLEKRTKISPIKFSNKSEQNNYDIYNETIENNTKDTTLEALSICNDIIENLNTEVYTPDMFPTNTKKQSNFTSSYLPESPKIYLTNTDKPIVSVEMCDADDSSNDSCKIIHDDSSQLNSSEISKTSVYSKTECVSFNKTLPHIDLNSSNSSVNCFHDKENDFEPNLKSMGMSPLKNSDFVKEINSEEADSCDDISIVEDPEIHSTPASISSFESHVCDARDLNEESRFYTKNSTSDYKACSFNNSIIDKINHESVVTPHKMSHLGSELPNLNQNIYDCKLSVSGCSHNENDAFENQLLTSPEVITCDTDDELDMMENDNNIFQSQSRTSFVGEKTKYNFNEKITKFSSNTSFDSDSEKTSDNVSLKTSPIIKSKLDCLIDSDIDFFESDGKKTNYSLNSSKVVSESHVHDIHGECNQFEYKSRPEVITFDSDEENVFNRPSLIKELSDDNEVFNDEIPLAHSYCDPDNVYLRFLDKDRNVEDDISKDVSSPKQSENVRNFEFNTFLEKSLKERIGLNKIQKTTFGTESPESPWVIKSKKSEEDFKLPNKIITLNKVSNISTESKIDSISVNVDVEETGETTPVQKKRTKQITKSNLFTPNTALQQFKISDSPVTPLPDYQNMATPEIKEALKKIGVKAMSRKKAIAMLSHVYEETHPLIPGSSNPVSEKNNTEAISKLSKSKKSKPNSVAQKRKRTNEKSEDVSKKTLKIDSSPIKAKSQDSSFSSPDSKDTKKNAYNLSFSSDFSDSSQTEGKEKVQLVSDYILKNEELYKQILTYTPLNLIEFQGQLKENGITIGLQKLMDFLDEQCITFHYPRNEVYRKKQQIRTQRFRKRMIAKLSQNTQSNS